MSKSIQDLLKAHNVAVPEDDEIERVRHVQVTVADIKNLAAPKDSMSEEQRETAIGLLRSVVGFTDDQKVTVSADAVEMLGGSVGEAEQGKIRKIQKSPPLKTEPGRTVPLRGRKPDIQT